MQKMPFMFMPMPGGFEEERQNSPKEAYVPARVSKALEFLSMLHHKQMDRAAVSESQIQIIDGKKLSPDEEATMTTALNMLAHYFEGHLPPDKWEEAKKHRRSNKKHTVLNCPICGGQPGDHKCVLCKGKGSVLVVS